MNSTSTKTDALVNAEKAPIDGGPAEGDAGEIRVLRSKLVDADYLAMAEDYEIGGDPYNSTGRHVILKPLVDDQT